MKGKEKQREGGRKESVAGRRTQDGLIETYCGTVAACGTWQQHL